MRRADAVLLVVVGVLLALAVVAAVVGGSRSAGLDPATPEGTVQGYLRALADGDTLAAADLLGDAGCDASDVAAAWLPPGIAAQLVDAEVEGTTASVRVEIAERYDTGPFATGGYEHTERFLLEEGDDGWRIVATPWPLSGCGRSDR